MLKITVGKGKGTFEFEGTDHTLAIEAGIMMLHLVKNLRRSGRSDDFIRGLFDIAMEQEEHE